MSHLVINLRGTNGSGKTSLANTYRTHFRLRTLGTKWEQVNVDQHNKYCLIGQYAGKKNGGCDTIRTQDQVKTQVRKYSKRYALTVFEGLLVSGIYAPWSVFADSIHPDKFVFAFMDTPIEVCLERVYTRNGGKPFKEENVTNKHAGVQSARNKALADLHLVWDIDHTNPFESLMECVRTYDKV